MTNKNVTFSFLQSVLFAAFLFTFSHGMERRKRGRPSGRLTNNNRVRKKVGERVNRGLDYGNSRYKKRHLRIA